MEKAILQNIKNYLKEKYNCHSIILYGSFANGAYTDESDIDIICFGDDIIQENNTTVVDGRQLDAWIYNTNKMTKYEELLHIKGGKILLDEKDLCSRLLENIDKLFNNGPKKLSEKEINFQKSWLMKMVKRAKKVILRVTLDIIGYW
ncbi:nucleotidyltransferase family protein [Haloimpatiens sp. FM7330]|uniref:nucleotidyltransferase family protein n=1 Tax=Haloimpatiens sp. FM7330 TaxID=3298610 RepID=UPI003625F1CD